MPHTHTKGALRSSPQTAYYPDDYLFCVFVTVCVQNVVISASIAQSTETLADIFYIRLCKWDYIGRFSPNLNIQMVVPGERLEGVSNENCAFNIAELVFIIIIPLAKIWEFYSSILIGNYTITAVL